MKEERTTTGLVWNGEDNGYKAFLIRFQNN